MNIVVNARFLTQSLSGVQRYAIECSRQIKKTYQNVTFVSPGNIIHEDIGKELGVIIIGKNSGHFWEQIDLPLYLSKNNFPPLVCLSNTGPIFYKNSYLTIHDLAFHLHPEWNSTKFAIWYNFLVPTLARRARHIFTVSREMKNEIIKYYKIPSGKISITYNGISRKMQEAACGETVQKEKIILSVGSFNKRKNHQNLISAFVQSELKTKYQLIIVGDKNKIFSDTNLDEDKLSNNNIVVFESLGEQALINMYKKSEVVISLSLYEGFGIPLLEGLYFGCKVVCSDIPVYREIYSNCAHFCDPLDIMSVIAALNFIIAEAAPSLEDTQLLFESYNYLSSAKTILDHIVH